MEAVNYFLSLETILFVKLWLGARPDELRTIAGINYLFQLLRLKGNE